MPKSKRLDDSYRFPGFRPSAQVKGVHGERVVWRDDLAALERLARWSAPRHPSG